MQSVIPYNKEANTETPLSDLAHTQNLQPIHGRQIHSRSSSFPSSLPKFGWSNLIPSWTLGEVGRYIILYKVCCTKSDVFQGSLKHTFMYLATLPSWFSFSQIAILKQEITIQSKPESCQSRGDVSNAHLEAGKSCQNDAKRLILLIWCVFIHSPVLGTWPVLLRLPASVMLVSPNSQSDEWHQGRGFRDFCPFGFCFESWKHVQELQRHISI